jgi:hypothetical protein
MSKSQQQIVEQPDLHVDSPSWGEANDRRGLAAVEIAIKFVKAHPIDTVLLISDFDAWAQHNGLLNVPFGAPKQSDAWQAHCQRRHQLKTKINRSGIHPRLAEMGSTPFSLDVVAPGTYEVRSPQTSAMHASVNKKVDTLIRHKRRQLQYLMQSADWSNIPVHERVVAETVYDDINDYADVVTMQGKALDRKFARIQSNIQRAIDRGEIKATPLIQRFVDGEGEEDSEKDE